MGSNVLRMYKQKGVEGKDKCVTDMFQDEARSIYEYQDNVLRGQRVVKWTKKKQAQWLYLV